MLLNKDNYVFVGKRIDTKSDAWQMPQGGIDDNESASEAALRELKEETGINNAVILGESKNWIHYDLPEYLIPRLWNGKYRGQKQKWFILKFLGTDDEINLQTEVPEFMEWRWVKMEELPNIIVPFKRKLYISIIEEFRDIILSLKH
jgi:putative (di)nucleoside polyphosphate hydrolase